MTHIKLEIKANETRQEQLIALLNDFNPTGFEQNESTLSAYFTKMTADLTEIVSVVGSMDYTISEIAERNWNEEWERGFEPVVVEDFCAVRADFHDSIRGIQHEIIITPKMSFGTGHHPTTYLMLAAMREIDFIQKSVFDFGTGTGILAIMANKLGSTAITAIDVDEWSVRNAAENFKRNKSMDIELSQSTQIPDKMFDVILANINRNVIVEYMSELVAKLSNKGVVLFSGLLVQDREIIERAALDNNLQLLQFTERNGWIALRYLRA